MKASRNLWPLGIVALLVAFFIGIMTMVVIASSQHTDLVSENYYAEELSYQVKIDGLERARQSGASLQYHTNRQELVISPGSAVAPAEALRLKFYRPSAAGLDQEMALEPGPDGRYSVFTGNLLPGLWKVRVSWSAAGKENLLEGSITNLAIGHHPR